MIYIVTMTSNKENGDISSYGIIYVGEDEEKAYSIAEEKSKNVLSYNNGIPYIDVNIEKWRLEQTVLPSERFWMCR